MRRGFTLIELTVSVGILALLGALILVSFINSRNTRDMVQTGQSVLSQLRVAQEKTLAGENKSVWGVHFEQGQFVLFEGPAYPTASSTEVFLVPASLEIVNISLNGGGQNVVFNPVDGSTNQAGALQVRIKNTANIFSVTIDGSGKSYQTGTAPTPSGSRVVDLRHRNFTLTGTLKNSTTMTLRFYDPPNPDTVSSVAMAPAAPRTAFDWSGSVAVGGQNQVLRIHALSITDTATTLSVDRDCRTNTKKLKISFDGLDMATYEADCQTLTVYPFGGTAVEP